VTCDPDTKPNVDSIGLDHVTAISKFCYAHCRFAVWTNGFGLMLCMHMYMST
jgi:hypothetical protein